MSRITTFALVIIACNIMEDRQQNFSKGQCTEWPMVNTAIFIQMSPLDGSILLINNPGRNEDTL